MQRILWLILVADMCYLAVTYEPPKPPSKITRENYDRIQSGMTDVEVEAILGPPGNDGSRFVAARHGNVFRQCWFGEEGVITVSFYSPQERGQVRPGSEQGVISP